LLAKRRVYPKHKYSEVVFLIDNAPWHPGAVVKQALADNPHVKLKRLPGYSPQVNPIERFWKKLRRRATHNRLFDRLADLEKSLRASLCYFQTRRDKVKSLLQPRQAKKPKGDRITGDVDKTRAAHSGVDSLGWLRI
jgi:transposase